MGEIKTENGNQGRGREGNKKGGARPMEGKRRKKVRGREGDEEEDRGMDEGRMIQKTKNYLKKENDSHSNVKSICMHVSASLCYGNGIIKINSCKLQSNCWVHS